MKDKITKGLFLFVIFTAAAYAIIFFFYLKGVPRNAKIDFNWVFISGIIILFVIYNYFNILRVYFLGRIFSKEFTFYDSASFTLGGVLLALITPFQAGGMPFQLYIMSKRGIAPGEGTSILISRGFQSILVFIVTIPFTMIFFSQLLTGSMVAMLLRYFMILYSILFLTAFILIAFTNKIKKYFESKRINKKVLSFIFRILDEVINFKKGIISMFTKGLKENMISILCSFIALYAGFAVTYFLVRMVYGRDDFFLAFNIQFILTYLSAFVPTPGSSGVAEGGIALLYSQVVAKEQIIIFIFLLRLITTYIPAFLGLLLMFDKKNVFREMK
ncbi:TPA: hypothetical protein DCW38_03880 [candidate division WOR-3 bacterium]|uniref:Flippase-like domain-containing protein n=1 Tax=candidate division WOR-3 bacterium TaxID=2052148 RepID=A0A350H9T5_UNCW3|nr:hypothetical protein [candidate division WOR-3 bacterium]